MCYNCLSILNEIIGQEKTKKLKEYFIGLTPNNRDLITVSKISSVLDVDNETAVKLILKCEEEGVLQRHFGIRCPCCGMLIRGIPTPSLDGISISECYGCDEEINISEKDIVILFKLIKVEIPFEYGQQSGQSIGNDASIVAREDSFKDFQVLCKSINRHFEEKRLEEYREKIVDEKMKKIHREASSQAERNRKINISLNIVCIIVDLVIISLIMTIVHFQTSTRRRLSEEYFSATLEPVFL